MGGFSGSVQSVIAQTSGVKTTVTSVTTETALATINIPPLQPNSQIRVWVLYSANNNANSKTFRVRFGGISGTIYFSATPVSTANSQAFSIIRNRGATNSQVGSPVALQLGASGTALVTSSVDTSVATTLVITGELANGADNISLEAYTVEIINP